LKSVGYSCSRWLLHLSNPAKPKPARIAREQRGLVDGRLLRQLGQFLAKEILNLSPVRMPEVFPIVVEFERLESMSRRRRRSATLLMTTDKTITDQAKSDLLIVGMSPVASSSPGGKSSSGRLAKFSTARPPTRFNRSSIVCKRRFPPYLTDACFVPMELHPPITREETAADDHPGHMTKPLLSLVEERSKRHTTSPGRGLRV
jgi:hypothetical protein